jgi:plastocyanin
MQKRYLFVPLLLIIIAAGYFYWNSVKTVKKPPQSQPLKKIRSLPKEVTIVLDKKGFSPNETTIKVGSAIRWKNTSGDKQSVNSDNYPSNQLHKELNFGIIANGSSVVYIFKTPDSYGYHNQLHPEQSGKVIVTK